MLRCPRSSARGPIERARSRLADAGYSVNPTPSSTVRRADEADLRRLKELLEA
jgi:hypothetical protein